MGHISRRGTLGGVMALFGAGAAKTRMAQAAALPPVAVAAAQAGASMPGANAIGMASGPDKRWDLFHELLRASEDRRRRTLDVAALLGGYPPHLASMHSCAPWFRAQRAVKWAQQQRDEGWSVEKMIRKQVFGDDA